MENIFEQLGEILKPVNPETVEFHVELKEVERKIEGLERQQNGGYTSQVAKSFHLGMVGGSGRNVRGLNKRRSAELDKTIDRAVILCELYKKRNGLKAKIEYIESGKRDADKVKAANLEIKMAEYWKSLKVGDKLIMANDAIITKKNAKSCETESGCKWTAAEVIGRKAAALL